MPQLIPYHFVDSLMFRLIRLGLITVVLSQILPAYLIMIVTRVTITKL